MGETQDAIGTFLTGTGYDILLILKVAINH